MRKMFPHAVGSTTLITLNTPYDKLDADQINLVKNEFRDTSIIFRVQGNDQLMIPGTLNLAQNYAIYYAASDFKGNPRINTLRIDLTTGQPTLSPISVPARAYYHEYVIYLGEIDLTIRPIIEKTTRDTLDPGTSINWRTFEVNAIATKHPVFAVQKGTSGSAMIPVYARYEDNGILNLISLTTADQWTITDDMLSYSELQSDTLIQG